jgi:predicted Zn-dependent peptidase
MWATMSDSVRVEQLASGLTLVMEPMRDVQSAAFTMLIPAGSVADEPSQNGTAAILSDLLMRGAGPRDSRQLSLDLDNLGVQRSENTGPRHITLSGATLGENLPAALRIYADVLLRPLLPADQFDACRAGLEQSLMALEDDHRQKIMYELKRRTYPTPWGQPTIGTLSELPNITAESVRRHWQRCSTPRGTILGVAGQIDPDEILQLVSELLSDWEPFDVDDPPFHEVPARCDHIRQESTQTHIALSWDSVPYPHPDYYQSWAAVSVLSGGMSSRLWTEVREKRGLCYDVHATLHSLRDQARVLCYAGSLSERAQETLDVMWAEIQRLPKGILDAELDRCRARAKSSLIMQQESTSSRSSSIARDWYHLGRVVSLDEIHERIDGLTPDTVLAYLSAHPPRNVCQLTLGPAPLQAVAGAQED